MSALAACDPGANQTKAEPELQPEELAAFGEGTVMFCVRDAAAGEVSILHGTHEVIVSDSPARRSHPARRHAVQAG